MFIPCPVIIDLRFKIGMYVLIGQSFVADFQFIVRISVIRVNRFSVCAFFNGLVHKTFLGCFLIGCIIIISNSEFRTQPASQYRQILHQPQIRLQHTLIQFIITYVRQIGYRVCFQHIVTAPESILCLHGKCSGRGVENLFKQSSFRCGGTLGLSQHTEHTQFQFCRVRNIHIQIHAKIEEVFLHLGVIAICIISVLAIQQSHIVFVIEDTEITKPLATSAESNVQLMTGRMIA